MPTAENIAAEHPEAAAALRAEGASAERARIQSIESIGVPGHEALIASLKFDGVSTAGDASLAILSAEKATRAKQATSLAADAPNVLEQTPQSSIAAASVDSDATPSRADLDAKAKAHMAAHPDMSYIAAYKAVGGK